MIGYLYNSYRTGNIPFPCIFFTTSNLLIGYTLSIMFLLPFHWKTVGYSRKNSWVFEKKHLGKYPHPSSLSVSHSEIIVHFRILEVFIACETKCILNICKWYAKNKTKTRPAKTDGRSLSTKYTLWLCELIGCPKITVYKFSDWKWSLHLLSIYIHHLTRILGRTGIHVLAIYTIDESPICLLSIFESNNCVPLFGV